MPGAGLDAGEESRAPRVGFVSLASLFVDDLVFPDGTTRMKVLGGGGIHAIVGMSAWCEPCTFGMVVQLGKENDPALREQVQSIGADIEWVVHADLPTPRGWNLFEEDGRRGFMWRTSYDDYKQHFRTQVSQLPARFKGAAGYHLLCAPDRCLRLLDDLGACRDETVLLWEPAPEQCEAEYLPTILQALARLTIFSPGHEEAARILSHPDPYDYFGLARAFRDRCEGKPPYIIIRAGAAGSFVLDPYTGKEVHVPALPVDRVVDVTGCGNSYCGGAVVGYARTRDIRMAAMHGAVSASFTLAHFGVPPKVDRDEATRRLNACVSNQHS